VVAQPGSALAWGARGRWFESSPPDRNWQFALPIFILLSFALSFIESQK
jgi:hypothetical protein